MMDKAPEACFVAKSLQGLFRTDFCEVSFFVVFIGFMDETIFYAEARS